jgi:hypothetical protein
MAGSISMRTFIIAGLFCMLAVAVVAGVSIDP